jgi:serine/threonine protein kinase
MSDERAEQWRRQKALFQRALVCNGRERQALLDEARRMDAALAAEVEAMIGAHEKTGQFLDAPLTPVGRILASAEQSALGNDTLLGVVLDAKYRIEEQLGRGGMGAVYRATHVGTDRPVAVKIIAPEFMAKTEFVERFKREAKAAGRLVHPNVVNVTDFGFASTESGRLAYLVMEYLDGMTLGDLLAGEDRLDLDRTIEILEQVGLAVDAAHAQGIIHRDLKPENIWLQPDGRDGYVVKVLDFGLATLRELPEQAITSRESRSASGLADAIRYDTARFEGKGMPTYLSVIEEPTPADEAETRRFVRIPEDSDAISYPQRVSHAGVIMGTPAYMSPEQCRGERLDETSDVYALGVIAYQMLTGETPFRGDATELLVKHGEAPPPSVRERWRKAPEAVETVLMSALAKVPSDRPPTPGAFAAALRTAAGDETRFERDATHLLQRHHSAFSLVVALAQAPLLAVTALLVSALISPFDLGIPGLGFVVFLVAVAMLFASLDLGAAASTLAARQVRDNPNRSPRTMPILKRLWDRARPAMTTILRGCLRPYSVFAGVIAVVEDIEGAEAVARSRALASRVRHLVPGVYAGAVVVAIIIVGVSALLANLSRFVPNEVARLIVGAVLAFLSLTFSAASASGMMTGTVARALIYDAARCANGESDRRLPER